MRRTRSRGDSKHDSTFFQFPARTLGTSTITIPKLRRQSDELHRNAIEDGTKRGPNFAGHYALVQFRMVDASALWYKL